MGTANAKLAPLTAIPINEKISFANANPMTRIFRLAEANASPLIR